MSGMGGNFEFILQFISQFIQQWMIVVVLSCSQVSQQNLWQVCVSAWLDVVKQATPSNCWKLSAIQQYRSGVERSAQQHHGETHGYGKNLLNRDNQQPSTKDDASAHLCIQFRDLMWVEHRRFMVRTNKHMMRCYKIKSVPLETGLVRGISHRRYPVWKESVLGSRKRMEPTLAYSN